MAYGTVNADVIQSSVSGVSLGAGNATVFKNRIINGDMRIDQRNAGSAITPTSTQYMTDRFSYVASAASKFTAQQNAGSVTPPAGFINYLGMTSTSAYSIAAGDYFLIRQYIEGLNIADLAWGTANAKTVTLSFWVYSSLTGTFGGSLQNSAQNRGYPFSYTISSANTWTQISVTIPGDTTGTWLTTNSTGIQVNFSLGTGTTYSGTAGSWVATTVVSTTGATSVVGTNGATFYITGVQLEVGSSATGFEYRDYGRELAMCYRYYRKFPPFAGSYLALGAGLVPNTTGFSRWGFTLDTPMRTAPSAAFTNCVGWNGNVGGAISPVTVYSTVNNIDIDLASSGLTGGGTGCFGKVLLTAGTGAFELGAEL